MGRRDEGDKRVAILREPPRGGGVSLGDALRKAGIVAEDPHDVGNAGVAARKAATTTAGSGATADLSRCGRLVLRRERKGHGGRTVTRIEGLGLDGAPLDALAREVARAMGCGARSEEGVVIVQGEPGDRLQAWLQARGVQKVVRGN